MTFDFVPHPRIADRKLTGPATTRVAATQVHGSGQLGRFNAWLGLKITSLVGTMWCAYGFAALALISLPDAIKAGKPQIISWIAQTFLQLVLLSIIIVGQNILASAADARSQATYEDADAVLHTALAIEEHLQAQDALIAQLLDKVAQLS